jgi:hypothetical protein
MNPQFSTPSLVVAFPARDFKPARRPLRALCLAAALALPISGFGLEWSVVGADRMDVAVLRGEAPLFILENRMLGPGWRKGRLTELAAGKDGKRIYSQDNVGFHREWYEKKPMPGVVDLRYELSRRGPREFRMVYEISPDSELGIGSPREIGQKSATAGPVIPPAPFFKGGKVFITRAGKTEEFPFPAPQHTNFDGVQALEVRSADGQAFRFDFTPPLLVHSDAEELRCMAGSTSGVVCQADETYRQEIIMTLPAESAFEPGNRMVDTAGWIPYERVNDFAPGSPIGMDDWLDHPAGRRGWLRMDGEKLVFEDGSESKFWGSNICHADTMPEPEQARLWARRYAKHGWNLMRWHKWTHPASHKGFSKGVMSAEDYTVPDPEAVKKFDNFHAELKQNGIYTLWSHIYRYKLSPADKGRIEHFDEVAAAIAKVDSTVGLVHFVPELQDIYIQATTNMLNHVNGVTGLRYADDPALAMVEMRNEDSIFFFGYDRMMRHIPTYAKKFSQRFAQWLVKQYGSFDAAVAAWGGLQSGESLESGVSPWFEYYYRSIPVSRRVADSYRFLFDVQDEFYKRYEKAIRDTGYKGIVIGSCWQAHSFLGHLWNVYSDSLIGPIDRHNYAQAPLNQPGVGLLSCFLQAVIDLPFGFSEWSVGGPVHGFKSALPMVAFYGMGLQGWDYSNTFDDNDPLIQNHIGRAGNTLSSMAQSPALARAVYRGDVKQGEIVGLRTVGIANLEAGDPGFNEQFNLLGGANRKDFRSVVPMESVGVGRVGLKFVEGKVDEPVMKNLGEHIDAKRKIVTSTTGQLRWHYADNGFFTVNTPGTKAVVGHAPGEVHELGEVSIRFKNPWATIYVTALDKDATVANGKRLLITTLARTVDKGTVFDEFSDRPIVDPNESKEWAAKTGPLLIEPVVADIVLRRKGALKVTVLDHEGRPTDRTVPIQIGAQEQRIALDGSKTQAIHYLVEWE